MVTCDGKLFKSPIAMATDRRAVFRNPCFYCGFNSLTHCLYNIASLRELVLGFDPSSARDRPPIVDVPEPSDAVPGKPGGALRHWRTSVAFTESYGAVFRRVGEPGAVLDLSGAVAHFEDPAGRRLFLTGPTDPLIEFVAVLSIYAHRDRVPLCPVLAPPMNRFVRLCSFLSSRGFENPSSNTFLQPSHRSSIFCIELENYFYDFTSDANPPDATVLHSLPPVICVHFNDLQAYAEKRLQLTVDFTNYVFDRSRPYHYRMNSFVMMHREVHATAYVRLMQYADTPGEKWLICDDMKQAEVGIDALHTDLESCSPEKRAIVGFYERLAH
jgi:hypothetical protein